MFLVLAGVGLVGIVICVLLMTESRQKTIGEGKVKPTATPVVVINTSTDIKTPKDAEVSYDKESKIVRIVSERLKNLDTNKNNLKFIVKMKSDARILFESDFVKPGEGLEAIEFSCELEPGEYQFYLDIETYSGEKNVGGQMTQLSLVVE